MTKRTIEVGKKYMLIHGDGEGPDRRKAPAAIDIDLTVPVTILGKHETHDDGEGRWVIEYTATCGWPIKGFASDRSFRDEEVKEGVV